MAEESTEALYLCPSMDFVFHDLFANNLHWSYDLIHLVTGLEGKLILTESKLPGSDINDKSGVADLVFEMWTHENLTKRIALVSLDMQNENDLGDFLGHRFDRYSSLLSLRQLGKGDDYEEIIPAIVIVVLNCIWIDDTEEYCHHYVMRTKKGHILSDSRQVYMLEAPKVKKYFDGSRLAIWLSTLAAHKREEFLDLGRRFPMMQDLVSELERMNADSSYRMNISRYLAESDRKTASRLAEEKGKAEGKMETLISNIYGFFEAGFDIVQIARGLKVSVSEVEAILAKKGK